MNLRTILCPDGSYEISLNSIGLNKKTIEYCNSITKYFTKGDEFFFGFFRTDGINLSNEEWEKINKEIPEHFKAHGRYEPIIQTIQKKHKKIIVEGMMKVGSLPVNDETYEMLPKLFHYHLETIYFCPKIDWKTFGKVYCNYMKEGANGYIMNGFTDFLFSYVDSGDFAVTFDPNTYDKDAVYREIKRIISE